MEELQNIPLILWIILGITLLIQSGWIFYDASKRGENKWLWGIFGLLNIPTNLIVYLIVTRKVLNTVACKICSKRIRYTYKYCPHCGKENKE